MVCYLCYLKVYISLHSLSWFTFTTLITLLYLYPQHWDSVCHGQSCFYFLFKAESVSYVVLMYNHIHRKLCSQGLLTHLKSKHYMPFDVI